MTARVCQSSGRRVVGPNGALAPGAAMLFLVSRCKPSIQLRSGSLVSSGIVPAIGLVWWRHVLYWQEMAPTRVKRERTRPPGKGSQCLRPLPLQRAR